MTSPDTSKKAQLRAEYVSRINRVMDHIEAHLGRRLSLDELARVACFSPYHFHRIFSAMTGETLNQYIARTRAEKAAMLLSANPRASITEVALDCGYSGSAAFSRAFREAFQMTPSDWRAGSCQQRKICKEQSKEGQTVRKGGKAFQRVSFHIGENTNNPVWRIKMNELGEIKVEVKQLAQKHVAYIRHVGPYAGKEEVFEQAFNKLMMWAGPRNLLRFPETEILSVYHDDPEITDESKLRTSCCITVPADTEVEGEVGKMELSGGAFAVAHLEITTDLYGQAWDMLMGQWMPESGYQPDDRLCYELYYNNPKEHPEGKQIVDICVPVKPL